MKITNKTYKIMIFVCLISTSFINILGKQQKNTNKTEILFTAEDSSTGTYNSSKRTAILGEEPYIKVIAINHKDLNKKAAQKLKKNKQYLGSYVDNNTNKLFYVYGIMKNPAPVDNGPDADVLTQIAINMDYGPGE